jgi:hypothetical protein
MSTKKPPQCGKCHAPVIFARTANGKHMPLDKARDLSGTSRYAVMRDTDLVLRVRVLREGEQLRPGVEHLHMPHFATCPEGRKLPVDGDDG